jgi:outer membrane protein TolC
VLDVSGALAKAMAHSPTLAIAVLELRRATLQIRAEQARYVPSFDASVGYTHNASPSLRVTGTEVGQSDALVMGLGVSHRFSFGTLLSADLELSGSGRRTTDPTAAALTLGPGYELALRLSATQPLLRGLGDDLGEAPLRQARLARDAATQARQRAASELARDVIGGYWELWYAQAAHQIQRDALAIARRQLAEAQARADAGRIPELDVLPLRTAVASAEERLVGAEVALRKGQLSLARSLGVSIPDAALAVGAAGPPEAPEGSDGSGLPERAELIAQAQAQSYELHELEAAVGRAREDVAVARDGVKPRLDATAWVDVAGLGNADAAKAFEMFGAFAAVSGFVGLALELPLVNDAARAQHARARAALQVAQERLRDAREEVTEAAMLQQATLREALARLASARKTAKLAAEVAIGQQKRFDAGAGTALELVVAEQDRSSAELRVARAQSDVAVARAALAHVAGRLLETLALFVPDEQEPEL